MGYQSRLPVTTGYHDLLTRSVTAYHWLPNSVIKSGYRLPKFVIFAGNQVTAHADPLVHWHTQIHMIEIIKCKDFSVSDRVTGIWPWCWILEEILGRPSEPRHYLIKFAFLAIFK